MRYKWFTQKAMYTYKEKVILANTTNGQWIRISKEVYEIIDSMIQNRIDSGAMEYDEIEDEEFLLKILNNLHNMKIILEETEEFEVSNKIASIELTHRCNLHCIHCCIDAVDNQSEELDIDYEDMIDIFNKLIIWNPKSIMLSGGEPMIRKDFFELVEYLRVHYSGHIMLSTNGLFINEKNAKKLCLLVDQIDMSLDGYDEETCTQIRGRGVFNKVIQSVNILKNNGFQNISLSMAALDKNAHWEKEFDNLNARLGTRPMFRLFSPVGRGAKSRDFFTDKSEDEIYIPKDFLEKDSGKPDNFCCCSAGKHEIFIDYKGDVYPCPSYIDREHLLGNIIKCDSVNTITQTYNNIQMVIEGLQKNKVYDKRCRECVVRAFCWTCPGSVEIIKTQKALQSQCNSMYPVLMERVWGEKV